MTILWLIEVYHFSQVIVSLGRNTNTFAFVTRTVTLQQEDPTTNSPHCLDIVGM
jgi:hypothetical protein